jgi:hypothetical protein
MTMHGTIGMVKNIPSPPMTEQHQKDKEGTSPSSGHQRRNGHVAANAKAPPDIILTSDEVVVLTNIVRRLSQDDSSPSRRHPPPPSAQNATSSSSTSNRKLSASTTSPQTTMLSTMNYQASSFAPPPFVPPNPSSASPTAHRNPSPPSPPRRPIFSKTTAGTTLPAGVHVSLQRPMGIVFAPNEELGYGVRIIDMPPQGAAAKSQQLCVGDVLISVNGRDCTTSNAKEVMALIGQAKGYVDLSFRHSSDDKATNRDDVANADAAHPMKRRNSPSHYESMSCATTTHTFSTTLSGDLDAQSENGPRSKPKEFELSSSQLSSSLLLRQKFYCLGETLRSPPHMVQFASFEDTIQSVYALQIADFAFVKRSSGDWSFCQLVERENNAEGEDVMTFCVDEAGHRKTLRPCRWVKMVRSCSNGITVRPGGAVIYGS